jgi:hypothetical protein
MPSSFYRDDEPIDSSRWDVADHYASEHQDAGHLIRPQLPTISPLVPCPFCGMRGFHRETCWKGK